jgi:hypothetical protein
MEAGTAGAIAAGAAITTDGAEVVDIIMAGDTIAIIGDIKKKRPQRGQAH